MGLVGAMQWLSTWLRVPGGDTSTSWAGWWDSLSVLERNHWPSTLGALFVWWQFGGLAVHLHPAQTEMAHHCWRSMNNGNHTVVLWGFRAGSIQAIDAQLAARHLRFWLITTYGHYHWCTETRLSAAYYIQGGMDPWWQHGYVYMCKVTMQSICLWSFCAFGAIQGFSGRQHQSPWWAVWVN